MSPAGGEHPRSRPLLYLSGFEPFLKIRENPTEVVAQTLDGERVGPMKVLSRVLPVTWEGAPRTLEADLTHHAPAACLLLGVSSQAQTVQVERFAYNTSRSSFADNDGVVMAEGPIDPERPLGSRLGATLDVDALVARLSTHSISAQASTDPGRYVCNRVYYAALARAQAPTIFVHLPHTHSRDPAGHRWSIERLTEACRVLLHGIERVLEDR